MIDSLSRLHLLGGQASENRPCFAVLEGTRRFFSLSTDLARWLAQPTTAREIPADLAAEVLNDLHRLVRVGFWPVDADAQALPLPGVTLTLGLALATSCNLACSYCNVRGYGGGSSLMTEETVGSALTFLQDEAASMPDCTAVLVLFGGEPTLNFEVLLAASREFRLRFPSAPHDVWAVTNGTLIDAQRAQALARHDVLCVVSLDGDREAHDANRRFAGSGEGSFDAVMRGIEHLRAAQARFTVRATWVPGSGDRLDRLEYLRREIGDAMQVTVAADFHADPGGVASYRETITREWDMFEASGYRTDAPATSAVLVDTVLRADGAPGLACPAGRHGYMIMPSGDIYACQALAAEKRLLLGNVREGGLRADRVRAARFALRFDDPGPACKSCPFLGLCTGPCYLVRPLLQPTPHCAVLATEVERACRFAASAPLQQLVARYDLGSAAPELKVAMARGAALRKVIWTMNRHLRPLALRPMKLNGGRSIPADAELAC